MVKRAFLDYISCFRWRNFVNLYKKSTIFIWILIFNIINMSNNLLKESTSEATIYFVWVSIFLFGGIGMGMCPMKLPKLMFLTPMNEKERKSYIQVSFWVRISVPTLVGAVVGIGLWICGITKGYMVLLTLVNLWVSFVFCAAEPTAFDRNDSRRQRLKTDFFSVAGMILAVAVQIVIIFLEEHLVQKWNICHSIVGLVMVTLGFMTVIYLKELPKRLEIYAVYEESM